MVHPSTGSTAFGVPWSSAAATCFSCRPTAPSTTRHVQHGCRASACPTVFLLTPSIPAGAQEEYLNGWLKGWLKRHSHDAELVDCTNSELVHIALQQVPPNAPRGWFADAGY